VFTTRPRIAAAAAWMSFRETVMPSLSVEKGSESFPRK
jgi:hypothetical protein